MTSVAAFVKGTCSSFASVVRIRHYDQKHLREGRVYWLTNPGCSPLSRRQGVKDSKQLVVHISTVKSRKKKNGSLLACLLAFFS